MNKIYIGLIILFTALLFVQNTNAQSVDEAVTISWPFNTGTEGQTATYSDGTNDYYTSNYVSLGNNLIYAGTKSGNATYTAFDPEVQDGGPDESNKVGFNVRPKTGLSFTPTKISFYCARFGTDSGFMDVAWKSSDGNTTSLSTNLKPFREGKAQGNDVAFYEMDLSSTSIPPSDGEFGLEVFIHQLGATKQIGLSQIMIEGQLSGTIIDVTTYSLSIAASPSEAGEVASFPVGTEFDEGTEIEVSATRNFGYEFSHWADASGNQVSTENPYTFNLNENTELSAVFSQLNTYELALNINGDANDYMLTVAPEGNIINNKRMYEEGTNVKVSAANNPILTFTNWSNGETGNDLSIVMSEDKDFTAFYSEVDYLAGWDFYRVGNNGRIADFYAKSENESAALVLIDANGNTTSWLDKSQEYAGGYEGEPGAVNWNNIANKYYYQITVNAKDYTDISVQAAILFNYNAYSTQKCEYSIDGETFKTIGTYELSNNKVWYEESFDLPAEADHAESLTIRWIPDYKSALVGVTTDNDGTAISAIYVTGSEVIYNDGVAPVLSSSIPTEGGIDASASGKVVLNFDEKVAIIEGTTANLNGLTLTPEISGKTITFPYLGLEYNTNYTFTLPANTVSDLAGNTSTTEISFSFTTMSHPVVSKKEFDFIVGVDGNFEEALAAAKAVASSGNRFYIFFPNGEYNIGALTGDGNEMTTIAIPNVSYVGESANGVVLYNKPTQEAINSTATIYFTSASKNIYMQDISLKNTYDYNNTTGRAVALWDQGDRNIYKNVKLLSFQDTYYTGSARNYLENCEIRGVVDFICGGGDIFFNECLIYLEERGGNVITAPASNGDWGYVFSNCTIDGHPINNGNYRLGRPWSNAPKCVYINTTMNVIPTSDAWGDPMNVVPSVFAEYNSMSASGNPIDLSNRRTTYTKDATTVTLDPRLTSGEAAQYTIDNVLGGTDSWQPRQATEQAVPPTISKSNSEITWNNSDYVMCWAILKDGEFVEFTTNNSYAIPAHDPAGTTYTVRSVNAMGGLGAESNSLTITKSIDLKQSGKIIKTKYYTLEGKRIATPGKGLTIVRNYYENGSIDVEKKFLK